MESLIKAALLASRVAILHAEYIRVFNTKSKDEDARKAKIKRLNEIKKAAEDLAKQTN